MTISCAGNKKHGQGVKNPKGKNVALGFLGVWSALEGIK